MVSRNRLINGPIGEKAVYVKPFARFAYHATTGEKKLFHDRSKYDEAWATGDWVDTPAKVNKTHSVIRADMQKATFVQVPGPSGAMVEGDEDADGDDDLAVLTNPLAMRQGIDHTKSHRPMPRYLSQMNIAELVLAGKEVGLDLSDRSKTRKQMRAMIEKAQLERMAGK